MPAFDNDGIPIMRTSLILPAMKMEIAQCLFGLIDQRTHDIKRMISEELGCEQFEDLIRMEIRNEIRNQLPGLVATAIRQNGELQEVVRREVAKEAERCRKAQEQEKRSPSKFSARRAKKKPESWLADEPCL